MDNNKTTTNSIDKNLPLKKFRDKSWVKKLEAASGKSMIPNKSRKTVYLLIDCSGSMSEGNKLEQAKKGAIGFAIEAQSKEYSVGLINFSTYAELMLDPQKVLTQITAVVEDLSPKGSTNMTAAIQLAQGKLSDKTGDKIICIITDGLPDNKEATLEAAKEARMHGIEIMAIGTDDADKSFLEQIVTRKELSVMVLRDQLERGIVSMAKMLPGKK
ncbi:MAG: VWA domain-containing protein [Candidatus Kuenenia sp.]|nr:VWA domain-containing protein [Candidatus Kuenenia hertensis]